MHENTTQQESTANENNYPDMDEVEVETEYVNELIDHHAAPPECFFDADEIPYIRFYRGGGLPETDIDGQPVVVHGEELHEHYLLGYESFDEFVSDLIEHTGFELEESTDYNLTAISVEDIHYEADQVYENEYYDVDIDREEFREKAVEAVKYIQDAAGHFIETARDFEGEPWIMEVEDEYVVIAGDNVQHVLSQQFSNAVADAALRELDTAGQHLADDTQQPLFYYVVPNTGGGS